MVNQEGHMYCLLGEWVKESRHGSELKKKLQSHNLNVIFLKATELSDVYRDSFDLETTKEAHKLSAQRDLSLCHGFVEDGFDVVYCNADDFTEMESWLEERFQDFTLFKCQEEVDAVEGEAVDESPEKGTVYWFTGLSGAGKTTLGTLWYERLRQRKPNVVLMDGDKIRDRVKCHDYTRPAREKSSYIDGRIAKILTDQGIDAVYCVIAMFDGVRKWNRENIPNYKEIFLNVPMEVLFMRDKKGLYSGARSGKIKDVVGMDQLAEFPRNPDVVVMNDGSREPAVIIEEIAQKLKIGEKNV